MQVSVITKELPLRETSVCKILYDDLGMKKVSSRWIPRLFTLEQKQKKKKITQESLTALQGCFVPENCDVMRYEFITVSTKKT